jgi:Flp pilus assembly protein TadG
MKPWLRIVRDDEGAAAVVVAVTLMVLMGMTAVAVDGGRLFVERSSVQNAADHAALAAAWDFCADEDEAAAEAAGLTSAASNGMDAASTTVAVEIERVPDTDNWQATVASQIEAPFGAVVGKDTMATSGTAIAGCEPGTDPIEGTETTTVTTEHGYAIFAGGSCSSKTIDGSGSTLTINGDIHSNKDIDWGGSGNVVNGDGTYVTTATMDTSKISWNPSEDNPTRVAGTISYSDIVSYEFADYAPGGDIAGSLPSNRYHAKTSGDWDLKNSNIETGVYYTPNNIKIGDSSLTAQVTLVAGGKIEMSGSNVNLTPYHGDLLAYSNSNAGCGSLGISMGGSTNTWKGTVYAPGAMIEYSGSTNSSVTGSLIGLHVRLNGSSSTFNYGGGGITTTVEGTEGTPGTEPVVDLLE